MTMVPIIYVALEWLCKSSCPLTVVCINWISREYELLMFLSQQIVMDAWLPHGWKDKEHLIFSINLLICGDPLIGRPIVCSLMNFSDIGW